MIYFRKIVFRYFLSPKLIRAVVKQFRAFYFWVILLVCSFIIISPIVQGQTPVFDYYGLQQGFNSREAHQFARTSEGFIWITTENGLVKYDGKSFEYFRAKAGGPYRFSNNYMTSIVSDEKDNLWISSAGNLDIFSPKSGQVINQYLPNSNKLSLGVYCIYYQKNIKRVWIGTYRGLYYADSGNLSLKRFWLADVDNNSQPPVTSLSHNNGDNILWAGGFDTVYSISISSHKIDRFPVPITLVGGKRIQQKISSIFCDEEGIIWYSPWGCGLFNLNPSSRISKSYYFLPPQKGENIITQIAKIKQPGQDEILWLSAAGIGLLQFNTSTKTFLFLNKTSQERHTNDQWTAPIKGGTDGFFDDIGEGLWIGSSAGFYRFDYSKQIFKSISLKNLLPPEGNYPMTNLTFTGKRQGYLFFEAPYLNYFLYSFEDKKINALPEALRKVFLSEGLASAYSDSNGILWLLTYQRGLTGMDVESGKIVSPYKKLNFSKPETSFSICTLRDSVKLIGCTNGLWEIKSNNSLKEVKEVSAALQKTGCSQNVICIFVGTLDRVWFVTGISSKKAPAIGYYNIKSGDVKIIFVGNKAADNFGNNDIIWDVVEAKDGKVYASNEAKGLMEFSPVGLSYKLKTYTAADGLYGKGVSSVQLGVGPEIWMSTDFGVARMNTQTGVIANYAYVNNAIGDNNLPSIAVSELSGKLCIGQVKEINTADTRLIEDAANNKPLIFYKIITSDTTIVLNSEKGQFVLPPGKSAFTVSFGLISYTNSQSNIYAWRFGESEDWKVTSENLLQFNHLNPGKYVLNIKAANSDGVWTEKEIRLKISVQKFFYEQWWFLFSILGIIAFAFFYYQRMRINSLKARYKLQEQIAHNLHDEVGSTLTSIQILGDAAKKSIQKSPERLHDYLERLSGQSRNVMQSMSDIVWSINPAIDKEKEFEERVKQYAANILEPYGIEISVSFSCVKRPLDNIYQQLLSISREAFTNIVKHTNATLVCVEWKNDQEYFCYKIKDNGVSKKSEAIGTGTGLKSIRQRVENINGSLVLIHQPNEGFIIEIKIPIKNGGKQNRDTGV